MKQFKFRSITCGLLGALLLLGTAAPLTFTACENEHPEISITLTSDYSGIIEAINNANKSLADKLALIEQAIKNGQVTSGQSLDLVIEAINSLSGSLVQKLAAIESAITNQTTSLESKLALIEAAVKTGFADSKTAQGLIKTAIESLPGSMAEKLEAVETAIKNQTTSLESKLPLIEAAVKTGFADSKTAQGLIKTAIESLPGSMAEKLEAVETAIKNQTTSLETKLGFIETALKTGFTDEKTALGQIKTALESIKGSVDGLDNAIDGVVTAIDKVTTAVDGTNAILTTGIAKALNDIFTAIDGLTDYSDILKAIKEAIENLVPKEINGYAYVEMGDGLKWATMNVGATRPEEYGDYFAWGETTGYKSGKTQFLASNYKWSQDGTWNGLVKYTFDDGLTDAAWYDSEGNFIGDKLTTLEAKDDAAYVNWGGTWRMPTKWEWIALRDRDNFDWNWTEDYRGIGIHGMIVTSKVPGYEGNSIFLPANGERTFDLFDVGTQGYYWSSTLYEKRSSRALHYGFSSTGLGYYESERRVGLGVRAVSD